MNTNVQAIQEAIIAEFRTQDRSPRRRDDVIAGVMNSGKFFVSEVRDTFNALTSSQRILRRQSWYVLAARPAPLPERPATPPPAPPVRNMTTEEYDTWAGAHPVVGTEAHTLVNATSEALCREVVWRLVGGKLPDACRDAVLGAFANDAFPRLMNGMEKKEA